jgi:hypothetical protein
MGLLFIMNSADLEKQETTNSVLLPLTDRLASVYLDFDVYNTCVQEFLKRWIRETVPTRHVLSNGDPASMRLRNLRLE